MEIESLIVLEARNPQSTCWQGHTNPGGSKERILPCLLQLLVVVGITWLPWLMATSLQTLHLSSHCPLALLCVSYKNICHQI